MEFRSAYQEHVDAVRRDLVAARAAGRTRMRVTDGEVDPSRLSDWAIESLAIRDGELIINTAINQHNEQVRKKGR